jgi:hypothetical protein
MVSFAGIPNHPVKFKGGNFLARYRLSPIGSVIPRPYLRVNQGTFRKLFEIYTVVSWDRK